jgi:hypothetical protein
VIDDAPARDEDDARSARRLAAVAAVLWLLVVIGLLAIAIPFQRMLREVGVPLLDATDLLLSGLDAVRAGWGLLPLLASFALLLAPLHVVPFDLGVRRWFRLWIVQTVVCGVSCALFLTLVPLFHCVVCRPLGSQTEDPWPLLVPTVVVALLQLYTWWPIARSALQQPRGSWHLEVARAALAAALPAALGAALIGGALIALDPPLAAGTLVIPLPLAGAGTAALAGCGLAIALRVHSSPVRVEGSIT